MRTDADNIVPMPACAIADQREGQDRRCSNLCVNLRYWILGGRRTAARRAHDQPPVYADRYDASLLFTALTILLLSCLDAVLTLNLLSLGAVEVNPLMAWLINVDVQLFINVKIAMTGICVVLLVPHKDYSLFGFLPVDRVMHAFVAMYAMLTAYEAILLTF